jgi:uncharacterized protein
MGIGEALITALNEKGIPTPLAHTLLRSPVTRMNILSNEEIDSLVRNSPMVKKYNVKIDRKSAFEILDEKISKAEQVAEQLKQNSSTTTRRSPGRPPKETSLIEDLSKNTMVRQIGRTIFRELTRGILGSMSGKRR